MKSLILFVALIASVYGVSFVSVVLEEWEGFKLEHSKKYETDVEESFRLKIFSENKHKIAKHNNLFLQGKKSYQLKMNHFGDLLHNEFVAIMNGFSGNVTGGYKNNRKVFGSTFVEPDNDIKMPDSVDWRTKGAVTPIKDQGQCGSCWSFSATGALEGQHFRKTGKLVSLSEQNLVDCSKKYGNNGCNGGLMDYAFQYVKDNRGIDTEDTYPYEGEDDKCRYNPSNSGADDTGFVDVRAESEESLMKAVATIGPVSVAIDAAHESFQFYNHGVYDEPDCHADNLDHGVLCVGYGTTHEGQEYWIVKNSWSEKWGDKGYVRMARNKNNQCGIASAASYPLV